MFCKSFPYIRQRDAMQCGIACIAMICKHYGKNISLDVLSDLCPFNSEGVSLLALSKVAKLLGFNSLCVKIPVSELYEIKLPIILHWNQNHYVVLYKIANNKFYIADPYIGKCKLTFDDFSSHWVSDNEKGIALLLECSDSFKHQEYSTPKRNEFFFIQRYLSKYKNYIFQILIGLIFGCLLQLILPFLTQKLVDIGINQNNFSFIWLVLLGQVLIVLGKTITDFIRRWIILHISLRIDVSLVSDFLIKLLKLKMSFFETRLIGDLLQRVGDHSRVQNFLTNSVTSACFSILSLFVFGIILLIYNLQIFLIFIIGTFVYCFWICIFFNKRRIIDNELFSQDSINQSKIFEMLSSIQEIKLQRCENRKRLEWEDARASLFDIKSKSLKFQQIQEAGSIFINELKNILITAFTAANVIEGNLTLGQMLAIQFIIGQLNSPVEQFVQFLNSFQDTKFALERINDVHNKEEEKSNSNLIKSLSEPEDITITNLSFKYDIYSSNYILNNLSLKIPKGKVTAIVGSSGSGKTTLLKMLLGFYSNYEGDIFIGKNKLEEYDIAKWREQCGIVMQDGFIFSDSITRNIAVDDNDINFERLEYAAKLSNSFDFISALPLKFNTKIGKDGIGLSLGQKQRLLIARAIYKHPNFVFLDEATNSLDAVNEKMIMNNLEQFYEGKTVLVIAHRLSTVRCANQIIVLENGHIAEIGNHSELTAMKGVYYNLVKNQLELG